MSTLAALVAVLLLGAACANDGGSDAAAGTGATGAGPTGGATGPGDGGGTTASAVGGGGGRYDYGGGGGGGNDEDGGGSATLQADNFAFSPTEVGTAAGSEITVANANEGTPHTFTVDGTDIDVELEPGETEEVTIGLDPGSYAFHCRFHASMTGTMTVT
jgi:plastocyanin